MAYQPCHVRSGSMPSDLHPAALKVEEELRRQRASAASPSQTPETVSDGLSRLGDLHASIRELLSLPCSQQTLAQSSQGKWVEEELDGSIRLLDACSTIKDSLAAMREHIQEVQLALRRTDGAAAKCKANDLVHSMKKTGKSVERCLCSLKKADDRCVDKDSDLPAMVTVMMQANDISISLLQQASSVLTIQTGRSKASRWPLLPKALRKNKVAHAAEHEDGRQEEMLEILSWSASCDRTPGKDVDGGRMLKVQDRLRKLEMTIADVECGLGCLYRQLIQNRVSLLNILSS